MTTIKARFDGRAFVPETPVELPVGYTLEIPIPASPPAAPQSSSKPLAELGEALSRLPVNPDWPADGAAEHDYYLYGTPKQR